MKVELEDVMFWMDAIRNSDDQYRTLESFWKGQLRSKVWLIENLARYTSQYPSKIVVHGGWNGVLSSLLFNSVIAIKHITSIDIDETCKETARTICKNQEMEGKFMALTADMCKFEYNADIVLNTSCEHITQEQYEQWLSNVPDNALIVLQSNNYSELDEHIRCASSTEEFITQSKLDVSFIDELELPLYTRYMIIGRKCSTH
jgi:hypothetical protein